MADKKPKVPEIPPIPRGAESPDADKTRVMAGRIPTIGPDEGMVQAGGSAAGADASAENDVVQEEFAALENLRKLRKKRRRRNGFIAGVVAALILVALIARALMGGADEPENTNVQTIGVYREDFVDAIEAAGKAQPASRVVVSPEVDGIITGVQVAEGQYVEKGAALFSIQNSELDKAVSDAELALRSAKTALAQAQTAYDNGKQAQAEAEQAQAAAAEREAQAQAAAEAEGVPYDPASVEVSNPEVDLQSLADAIDSAKLQVEQAQATYDEAVAQAAKRQVVAPESGTIVVMNAVNGAALGEQTQNLIEIADLSKMTVRVQVSENDIAKVAQDQAAEVSFSALPNVEAKAKVTRIASVSSAGAEDQGSSPVTYAVDVLIDQPVEGLKPGMTASVRIVQQEVANALTVPVSALLQEGDTYFVERLDETEADGSQHFSKVQVKVIAQSDSTAAIEGIDEGDEIALDPTQVDGAGAGDDLSADLEGADAASDSAGEGAVA